MVALWAPDVVSLALELGFGLAEGLDFLYSLEPDLQFALRNIFVRIENIFVRIGAAVITCLYLLSTSRSV